MKSKSETFLFALVSLFYFFFWLIVENRANASMHFVQGIVRKKKTRAKRRREYKSDTFSLRGQVIFHLNRQVKVGLTKINRAQAWLLYIQTPTALVVIVSQYLSLI